MADRPDAVIYNFLGADITGKALEYADPSYGFIGEDGIPHTFWEKENFVCDQNGFDKRYRPVAGSDEYLIKDFILPKGMIICRFGVPYGRFTTVRGTKYEQLGLPYKMKTIEYHEYQVSQDLEVECVVKKGIVAPQFNSPGGAVQFMHHQMIDLECQDGCLREVFSWLSLRRQNISRR